MAGRAELSVRWGAREIGFSLRRSEVKRLRITVKPDGSVEVTAPSSATDEMVCMRVVRRGDWIVRQLASFDRWRPRTPPRQYVSGETHLFLGRQYRLRVQHAESTSIAIAGDRLVASVPASSDRTCVKQALTAWYAGRARTTLRERYKDQGELWRRNGIDPPPLIVRSLTNRWGSLTAAGNLVMNADLVRASPRLIDYVFAHELAHVKHPNHGVEWRRLLGRVMPDWESRKRELEAQLL